MAAKAARTSNARVLVSLGIIVVCGGLAYGNSFDGRFFLDDISSITNNERIQELTPLSDHLSTRRPLATLSFALSYSIGKDDVFGYHVFNVIVHLLVAIALFFLVREAVGSERVPTAVRRNPDGFALAAVLLWVVHPLATQAVTYLVQRAESMMALFYVVTLLCYVRFAKSARGIPWAIAAVIAAAAAMACKGIAVTLPLMVLLFDRAFISESWKETARRGGVLALVLAAVVVTMLYVTDVGPGVLSPDRKGTVGFGGEVTSWEYLRTQPSVLLLYLRLAVLPVGQCLDWQLPPSEGFGFLLPGLVIVALLAATLWAWRRRPWLGFLGAWFFVILAPTSSFIPIKDLAFEHRTYLSLLAVIILVMIVAQRFFAKALASTETRIAVVGIVAVVLAVFTFMRNSLYCDEEAMWLDVVAKRPESTRAHNHLGLYYLGQYRLDDAERVFRAATEIDPKDASSFSNIGIVNEKRSEVAAKQGRPEDAKRHLENAAVAYEQATDAKPTHHVAWGNRGNVLARLGRLDEAIPLLRRSIAGMKRKRLVPWKNLCQGLVMAREPDAKEEIEALIAAFPGDAEAYTILADELKRRGDDEGVVRAYREAAKRDPTNARYHLNAGNALRRLKRDPEAAAAFREALRIDSRYVKARCNLAAVQLDAGEPRKALQSVELALRENPNHIIANLIMAQVQEALRQPALAIQYYRKTLELQPGNGMATQRLRALERP